MVISLNSSFLEVSKKVIVSFGIDVISELMRGKSGMIFFVKKETEEGKKMENHFLMIFS